VENDDDSDPEPQPEPVHAEWPSREKCESRMIPGRSVPQRRCRDVQRGLPARRDPEPSWPQAKPIHVLTSGPNARPPAERAGEPRPRDVDPQGTSARIPHGDDGGGRATERHAKRARAEPDAAAGRGTRDGCRGRHDDHRRE
jgi:hypothetical protein